MRDTKFSTFMTELILILVVGTGVLIFLYELIFNPHNSCWPWC